MGDKTMTMIWPKMALQAGALAITLYAAPAALAAGAESTNTAGPAAGGQGTSSAAVQPPPAPVVNDRNAARSPGTEGQKNAEPTPAPKGSSASTQAGAK
jgi:hypothetical protein